MRSVCFLLPGMEAGPAGGYKVVYEYVKCFCKSGGGNGLR